MTYNEFKRWFEPLQTFYRKQENMTDKFSEAFDGDVTVVIDFPFRFADEYVSLFAKYSGYSIDDLYYFIHDLDFGASQKYAIVANGKEYFLKDLRSFWEYLEETK